MGTACWSSWETGQGTRHGGGGGQVINMGLVERALWGGSLVPSRARQGKTDLSFMNVPGNSEVSEEPPAGGMVRGNF